MPGNIVPGNAEPGSVGIGIRFDGRALAGNGGGNSLAALLGLARRFGFREGVDRGGGAGSTSAGSAGGAGGGTIVNSELADSDDVDSEDVDSELGCDGSVDGPAATPASRMVVSRKAASYIAATNTTVWNAAG